MSRAKQRTPKKEKRIDMVQRDNIIAEKKLAKLTDHVFLDIFEFVFAIALIKFINSLTVTIFEFKTNF